MVGHRAFQSLFGLLQGAASRSQSGFLQTDSDLVQSLLGGIPRGHGPVRCSSSSFQGLGRQVHAGFLVLQQGDGRRMLRGAAHRARVPLLQCSRQEPGCIVEPLLDEVLVAFAGIGRLITSCPPLVLAVVQHSLQSSDLMCRRRTGSGPRDGLRGAFESGRLCTERSQRLLESLDL